MGAGAPRPARRALALLPPRLTPATPPPPPRNPRQVNAQAAARILAEQAGLDLEEGGGKKRKAKAGAPEGATLLDDDRFK